MQSGDTGVSLNPGPTLNNDNDEQYTQSSQSSIHACNGNSFLELPNNAWIFVITISELPLSSFSNKRKGRPTIMIIMILPTFFSEHFANISFSVQLNPFSDPPDWDCSANYVDTRPPSGVSYCVPLSLNILSELASSSHLLARLLGWTN